MVAHPFGDAVKIWRLRPSALTVYKSVKTTLQFSGFRLQSLSSSVPIRARDEPSRDGQGGCYGGGGRFFPEPGGGSVLPRK
jgi:hypothetical protein